MATSHRTIEEIRARQEELAQQVRELSEEVREFVAQANTTEEKRTRDEAIIAELEAIRERVSKGRVFSSSTDIVRKSRGYNDVDDV